MTSARLRFTRALLFTLLVSLFAADAADAQGIFKRARDAARRAAERQVETRTERAVESAVEAAFDAGENAIKCLFTDPECIRAAQESGNDVVLVDDNGRYVDTSGTPVTEANAETAIVRASGAAVGATNANYDFTPGDRVLFEDDFSRDNVGDFPRRLSFRQGSMEVVSFAGGRALRGKTTGAFDVVLPSAPSDLFTVEFDFQASDFVNGIWLYFVDAENDRVGANYVQVDPYAGVGVGSFERGGIQSLQSDRRLDTQMLPIRIMADGAYVKVFVGQERVANVPNADMGRSNRLQFLLQDVRDQPVYIANLRVASGGLDLYGALESTGRVVTEGVLFDTGSATLKPESFAVIQEIAAMMQKHPDLSIRVEGHTDSQGQAASNLTLSQSRATAVQTMLVGLGIGADRLEAAGMGQTVPVASNDTPDGRAQNRRVELVRL